MKYEFSNSEYIKAHGESPRGTGHWAFEIKNAEIPEILGEGFIEFDGSKMNTIFWVSGFRTLSEAKKEAAKMLTECNVRKDVTVYVAP